MSDACNSPLKRRDINTPCEGKVGTCLEGSYKTNILSKENEHYEWYCLLSRNHTSSTDELSSLAKHIIDRICFRSLVLWPFGSLVLWFRCCIGFAILLVFSVLISCGGICQLLGTCCEGKVGSFHTYYSNCLGNGLQLGAGPKAEIIWNESCKFTDSYHVSIRDRVLVIGSRLSKWNGTLSGIIVYPTGGESLFRALKTNICS